MAHHPAVLGTAVQIQQCLEACSVDTSPIIANKGARAPWNVPARSPRDVRGEQPFTRQAEVGSPKQTPVHSHSLYPLCWLLEARQLGWVFVQVVNSSRLPGGPSSRIASLGPRDHTFLSPQRTCAAAGPVTTLPGGELKSKTPRANNSRTTRTTFPFRAKPCSVNTAHLCGHSPFSTCVFVFFAVRTAAWPALLVPACLAENCPKVLVICNLISVCGETQPRVQFPWVPLSRMAERRTSNDQTFCTK